MELIKIEKLLESYFEGSSSLEEEQILQDYFSQSFVPIHLQEYKVMFNYFSENKTEISNQPIELKTKKRTLNKNWLSIAAAIVFLVTIYKIVPNSNDFTDIERAKAEKAFVESKKAFKLISKSLNRGNETIAYMQGYESTKNKIFKNN